MSSGMRLLTKKNMKELLLVMKEEMKSMQEEMAPKK